MKNAKTKTISLVLIASMLMPMTGCSMGQKKKVLETAEDYAEAVISGDIEDIADLMEDGDEFEDVMEEIASDRFEDIYDILFDNMSYEIDEKSVKVKDKKATVNITYTMIDYMDVYEDLEEHSEIEDYLEALEDAEDNTMEIDQKIELELDKDEWIVIDDDNENILEVYEFYNDMYELSWGGMDLDLSAFTVEHFQQVALDLLEDDDTYLYDGTNFDDCMTYGNGVSAQLEIYVNDSSAPMYFEFDYDDWEDMIANGEFNGEYSSYYEEDNYGYILFDGISEDDGAFSGYVYGAIIFCGNCYLRVYTFSDEDEKRDLVDAFLAEFGCEGPRR